MRLRIQIQRNDIHHIISGIILLLSRIPDPDQVVQSMALRKALIHEAPQTLRRLGPLGTPPEPVPVHFMEGPPENGNAPHAEGPEQFCHFVHIGKQCMVLRRTGGHRLPRIKIRILRIERLGPSSKGRKPVPGKCNEPLFLRPVPGALQRIPILPDLRHTLFIRIKSVDVR